MHAVITSARIRTLHDALSGLLALHEHIHQLIRGQLEDATLEAHPEALELLPGWSPGSTPTPRRWASASTAWKGLHRR